MFTRATNPRMLLRVLEQVHAGNRRPRGIAEVLGVETRVAVAYLAAGAWLGLLRIEDEPALTREGLGHVYARRGRAAAFRAVILAHPALGPTPPTLEDLAGRLCMQDPSLSPSDARRRAAALRKLAEPAWRTASRPGTPERQLALAFASTRPQPPTLDLRAGADDSPDAYALLYRALLDHGEVTPSHLRALLDRAGGESCGLGGYLAMAERRGDAHRVGDTLVVSRGAIQRRDLAESAVSTALSDPDFRRHLAEVLAGRPGDPGRWRRWSARLFGAEPPATAIERLLFGRPLHTFPLAGSSGTALLPAADPFLAVATERNLAIAFPSSLLALAGGLAHVNQALRAGPAVRPPGPVDRRSVVHGGLLHPGEAPPRVVADLVSLRARVLRNAPAFALLCALGALDRRGSLRVRIRGVELIVETPGTARRLDTVIEAVAVARGWTVTSAGVPWCQLVDLGEQLGLLAQPAGYVTLDEALFRRLTTDAEHRDLWAGLVPLADLLEARACR